MKQQFGEFYRYNYQLRLESPQKPKTPEWSVEFMGRRIKMVIDVCDKYPNRLSCDATDKFIIAALAQNGAGFTVIDLEIDILGGFVNKQTHKINWEAYFDHRQLHSDNTILQNITTNKRDYDTKYMLDLFSYFAYQLNRDGYWLPTLNRERIQTLIN